MRCYVVDAFADRVFEGNPAAVCILQEWLPDALMQSIATENNLSETAFAVKEGEKYRIRWFTPGSEIDLCGHATLAAGYVILRFVAPDASAVRFTSLGGELLVEKKENGLYEMDFPAVPTAPYPLREDMIEALGTVPVETYKGRDLVFLLDSETTLQNLAPDIGRLHALPEGLGVFVTAKADENKPYDFVSRAFWPKMGIPEDPVCGSMHCNLVPFWYPRLGQEKMIARQLSPRGGTLYLQYCGDRVKIAGKAALYSTNELQVEE